MNSKKITLIALLAAIALIFGYIESLFPIPLPIPGIKLGLGNIVILTALYIFDFRTSVLIMFIKVLLSALLFTSPSAFIYSFAGGLVSLLVMAIMKKLKFNIICTSMGGGISHNIAQLTCAALILTNINFFYYLPILIIAGSIVGTIVGIVSKIIIRRVSAML